MANLYYLDTNALIKYSVYQQYLTKPEEGVETIRTLINKNTGIFYISCLTLWEFHNVFLNN